ncbi:alpha/beta hydrolase [Mesorhizobium sp. CAU 1732]|uniref:alpha/beta hydrolase n=1 Tax=Mesorhizobium sp. CAU 1732 TaxID=3140358 RepID=UPI0032611F8F
MAIDSYIHKTAGGKAGGPLLFVFHGTGADENQFFGFGQDLVPGATVVSPRGDVSEHGAARFFRRTGEGVYDMADLERATTRMADFVTAHVEHAKPSAVLGLGYSNGANILASVIFAKPDVFDASVLMHPLIPFAPKIAGDLTSKRMLITAGRRDPICPPDLTIALEGHLRKADAEVELVWHDGGHDLRQNEVMAAAEFFAPYHATA